MARAFTGSSNGCLDAPELSPLMRLLARVETDFTLLEQERDGCRPAAAKELKLYILAQPDGRWAVKEILSSIDTCLNKHLLKRQGQRHCCENML